MLNNKGFYVAQRLREELLFMRAFINQQEKQINNYIENIDQYVETAQVEKLYQISHNQVEKEIDEVKHIEGISEDDYDFKGIFTEVMPLYQRQAMLVALWGRLECRLDDVVGYLSEEINKKRKPKPKGSSDFIHLIQEINRFGVNIRADKICNSATIALNNEVREIRNSWVHNGGKPSKNKTLKVVKSNPHLTMESGIINVSNEYIIFALEKMVKVADKISSELIARRDS